MPKYKLNRCYGKSPITLPAVVGTGHDSIIFYLQESKATRSYPSTEGSLQSRKHPTSLARSNHRGIEADNHLRLQSGQGKSQVSLFDSKGRILLRGLYSQMARGVKLNIASGNFHARVNLRQFPCSRQPQQTYWKWMEMGSSRMSSMRVVRFGTQTDNFARTRRDPLWSHPASAMLEAQAEGTQVYATPHPCPLDSSQWVEMIWNISAIPITSHGWMLHGSLLEPSCLVVKDFW